jgi:5-oxoprolinase (ATP-hydrolysing) subunit A
MTTSVDLNSDVGEGFGCWVLGDDKAMLEVVTRANIACGFHAGDPSIMRRTCDRAVAKGVRIGAHIRHQDLIGFGRRTIAATPRDLGRVSKRVAGSWSRTCPAFAGLSKKR